MTIQEFLLETYPGLSLARAERAFAERVGTSRQNISRYRKFDRFPLPDMIARIREASGGRIKADDHLPPQYREGVYVFAIPAIELGGAAA